MTREQILLLNSESLLKELKTHEIIFIKGRGGYYGDCGYGNGYRDYGYGNYEEDIL
ncbi:MAG: hypothetical protein PUP90_21855 [Nostoc sp. S4]|nr:hypothetical protein [Nostoc sp. S4]